MTLQMTEQEVTNALPKENSFVALLLFSIERERERERNHSRTHNTQFSLI